MAVNREKLALARVARGLSQKDLAARARTSQQTIAKLEAGTALTSKFLPRIAAELDVDLAELDPDFQNVATRGTYTPPPTMLGPPDLPVFSAVEGGPGAMVVSTDPIDHVLRPWFLREVREGYAVVVTGESMLPVYEPGDLVIVNPRLPAVPNKNAIFVGGEEHGEFIATVKRLERSTADDWHVRQYNPPEGKEAFFTLPKAQWQKAYRIVGRYEGG